MRSARTEAKDLVALVKTRPWLVPFFYHASRLGEFSPSQLARAIGTRTDYVRYCLRLLSRLGVVERRGEGRYAVVANLAPVLEGLGIARRGETYVVDVGGHYAVARVRSRYVKVFCVPKGLATRVLEALKKFGEAQTGDLASALGEHPKAVYRALVALTARGLVEKRGDRYRALATN